MTRHRRQVSRLHRRQRLSDSGDQHDAVIDVMLVLLIMFIITVPIATHGVKIDLPSGPLPPTARGARKARLPWMQAARCCSTGRG
jgi:hypothetical protein